MVAGGGFTFPYSRCPGVGRGGGNGFGCFCGMWQFIGVLQEFDSLNLFGLNQYRMVSVETNISSSSFTRNVDEAEMS